MRSFAKKAALCAASIVLSTALLEVALRIVPPPGPIDATDFFRSNAPPEHVNLARLGPPREIEDFKHSPPSRNEYDGELWKVGGLQLRPNAKIHARQLAVNGLINYDVEYEFDSQGWRATPAPPHQSLANVIVMGCSHVFGEGVRQDETIPARLTAFNPRVRGINFGLPGSSPSNLALRLQDPEAWAGVPREGKLKVVYWFIDHHVERVLGRLDIYKHSIDWDNSLRDVSVGENGQLENRGTFAQSRASTRNIWTTFGKSKLLWFLSIDWPYATASDLARFAKIILELGNKTQEWNRDADFYVAFAPNSKFASRLQPIFGTLDVKTIDYSWVDPSKYSHSSPYLPDGHPSAAYNELMARLLLEDIGL